MKVYIAGPMTGLPDLNFPRFNAVAEKLRREGHTVINPAELNIDPKASWQECMRVDIRELVTCEGIYLLPNWTMSRGARLEFHIASQLNMHIIEAKVLMPENQVWLAPRWFGIDMAAPSGIDKYAHGHFYPDSGAVTGAPE